MSELITTDVLHFHCSPPCLSNLHLHVCFTALAERHPHCHVVKVIRFLAVVSNDLTDKHKSQEEKESERDRERQRERGNRGIEVGLGFTLSGLCLKAV